MYLTIWAAPSYEYPGSGSKSIYPLAWGTLEIIGDVSMNAGKINLRRSGLWKWWPNEPLYDEFWGEELYGNWVTGPYGMDLNSFAIWWKSQLAMYLTGFFRMKEPYGITGSGILRRGNYRNWAAGITENTRGTELKCVWTKAHYDIPPGAFDNLKPSK